MRNSRPQSFRRLLILRLLLLGVPILLIGQYLTVRKARTGLLETARQNLANSAVRKADFLHQSANLQVSKLLMLSRSPILQGEDLAEIETLLQQFTTHVPLSSTCVYLLDADNQDLLVSTCNSPVSIADIEFPPVATAPTNQSAFSLWNLSSHLDESVSGTDDEPYPPIDEDQYTQINMDWASPVYASDSRRLEYIVVLRTQLSQLEDVSARSLIGYTTVIDEAGMVRVHPEPSIEGQPIQNLGDAGQLQNTLNYVQLGSKVDNVLHLFHFLPNHSEWLAGFSSLDIEVAPGQSQQWVVLAVTPIEHALQGLADIRNVLIFLTLGLLTAQVLLVLYLAQHLSRPIERLSDYAQKIQDLSQLRAAPQHFQVRELDYLASVFNGMLKRLEMRAQELRHAWQDAQIANQLKSEFLANTSHELRTPLNAIIGCIRLIRDDCCDSEEEVNEFLSTADQAAVHLLGIINDILDISKIESGTLKIELAPLDLRRVVAEVVALQRLHIQQKGLSLKYQRVDEPLWVMADSAKLKQVLLNIVYNAIKFTETGSIEITVHMESETYCSRVAPAQHLDLPTPSPRVVVSVIDTGIGIAPGQQKKLFQPFVMADGSTTRQHEGTGLGLSISRNLISLMGGSIALYSEGMGLGTQVSFALPLIQVDEAAALEQAGTQILGSPSQHLVGP